MCSTERLARCTTPNWAKYSDCSRTNIATKADWSTYVDTVATPLTGHHPFVVYSQPSTDLASEVTTTTDARGRGRTNCTTSRWATVHRQLIFGAHLGVYKWVSHKYLTFIP